MTEILILLLAVLVTVGALTLREISGDGLGRRRPPRSHPPEPFDPHRWLRIS